MRSYTELAQMQKSASYETIRKVASLIKSAENFLTQSDREKEIEKTKTNPERLSFRLRTHPQTRLDGTFDRFEYITGRRPVLRQVPWDKENRRLVDAAPVSISDWMGRIFNPKQPTSKYADRFLLNENRWRARGVSDSYRATENKIRMHRSAQEAGLIPKNVPTYQTYKQLEDFAREATRQNILRQNRYKRLPPLTSYKDLFMPNGELTPQKDLKLESDRKARKLLDKHRVWDPKKNLRAIDPRWERIINKGKIFGNYKKPGTSNTDIA